MGFSGLSFRKSGLERSLRWLGEMRENGYSRKRAGRLGAQRLRLEGKTFVAMSGGSQTRCETALAFAHRSGNLSRTYVERAEFPGWMIKGQAANLDGLRARDPARAVEVAEEHVRVSYDGVGESCASAPVEGSSSAENRLRAVTSAGRWSADVLAPPSDDGIGRDRLG